MSSFTNYQGDRHVDTAGGYAIGRVYKYDNGAGANWFAPSTPYIVDDVVDGQCTEVWIDMVPNPAAHPGHRNPSVFRRCQTGGYGWHDGADTWGVMSWPTDQVIGWDFAFCKVNYSGSAKYRSDCRNEANNPVNWPNVYDGRTDAQTAIYLHGV
jgi:hypothetical protein